MIEANLILIFIETMETIVTTNRLNLCLMEDLHADDLFEMDADPDVHLYIDQSPLRDRSEQLKVIRIIQNQYETLGIGRWSILLRETNECIGWAGLKKCLEPLNGYQGYYDLGYRLKKKHWGKGYATEASHAVVRFGFAKMGLDKIHAAVDAQNLGSQNVLTKIGFEKINSFSLDDRLHHWFTISTEQYPFSV